VSTTGLRVVVAAEDEQVRDRIRRTLRWESGVSVVGQARNAVETVALVKSLQPELTLVDSKLPYRTGLDGVRLSRMSGLDTAMIILEQSPGRAAVVLNNPSALPDGEQARSTDELVRYFGGARIAVDLKELFADGTSTGRVVFADLWVNEQSPARSRLLETSDDVIVCGGLAVVGGLLMAATIIGLIPGAIFVAGGATAVLSGFLMRAWAKWQPRWLGVGRNGRSK